MEQTGSERALEPFPAIDPEPPRRFMLRRPTPGQLRWGGAGACLLAAGATAVALTWPWTAGTAPKQLAAPFTDRDGVIVFEEQPSGELGSARPDGSGVKLSRNLGTLQGYDLPVVSPDDRFMVDQAGQVVALGPARALSVTFSGAGAQLQSSFGDWQDESFADDDKFITAAECDGGTGATWQVSYASTTSGGTGTLGSPVDINDSLPVAGDPQSAGAFAVPGSSGECTGQNPAIPAHGDSGVVYQRPKQAPRTVITAATLLQVLGTASRTPVLLSVYPSPDGSLLAVTVSTFTMKNSQAGAYPILTGIGTVIVTRSGQVKQKLPGFEEGDRFGWSPDSKRIAVLTYTRAVPVLLEIWTLTGGLERIAVTASSTEFANQLLWSPDGSQLAVSWERNASTYTAGLVRGWTVLDLRTKQEHNVTAPGQPAAWLPGQGATR